MARYDTYTLDAPTHIPAAKKYSVWSALVILCVAFGLPLTIGTMEIRIARNAHAESEAIGQLEAIAKAETAFRDVNHRVSANLAELNGLTKPDPSYRYEYRQQAPDGFSVTAEPVEPGKHGKRFFYTDQSGVIRFEVLHPANAASPVVPASGDGKSAGES